MNVLGLILLVLIAAAVLAIMSQKERLAKPFKDATLPFRRKDYLLTKAERAFYLVLLQTIGAQWRLFAKVRMLDLLWLPRGTPGAQAHRNRVQSKHVDFVLCSNDFLRPELVIELDDRSHEQEERHERDEMVDRILNDAGIPVLRVPAQAAYTPRELMQQIQQRLGQALAENQFSRAAEK